MEQLYADHGIVMIITKWVKMFEVQKQHAYKVHYSKFIFFFFTSKNIVFVCPIVVKLINKKNDYVYKDGFTPVNLVLSAFLHLHIKQLEFFFIKLIFS